MKKAFLFFFELSKTYSILNRKLFSHGLAFSDFMILYYLNESPDGRLRRVDLADCLGLTASGITRMILPLEKIGIIKRDEDGDDARARYASLTKTGKELFKEMTDSLTNKMEDFIPEGKKVDWEEMTRVLASLKK